MGPSFDTDIGAPDLTLFLVTGSLPNGFSITGLSASVDGEPPIYIASGTGDTNFVSMIVGSGVGFYDRLRTAQCEVKFHPRSYRVNVDVINSTISVVPVFGDIAPSAPPNATLLISKALNVIGNISQITATSVGTSPAGNAFINNIDQSRANSSAEILRAIRDSIVSIVDNSLVAVNSAQLLLMPESSTTSPVQVSYPAVAFGTRTYIDLVIAAQAVVCFIYLEELVRTGFWSGVSTFSFNDASRTILAASGGGMAIAEAAVQRRRRTMATTQHIWRDEEKDVDRLRVRLLHDQNPGGPVLVLDDPYSDHRPLGHGQNASVDEDPENGREPAHSPPRADGGREDGEGRRPRQYSPHPHITSDRPQPPAPLKLDVNIPLGRLRTVLTNTISPESPRRPGYQRLESGQDEEVGSLKISP